MERESLSAIRERIGELARSDGRYVIRCGRTGERPVPVDDKRFPDRETAAQAVQTAEAYRALLRRHDPRARVYDFIVCERAPGQHDETWVATGHGEVG